MPSLCHHPAEEPEKAAGGETEAEALGGGLALVLLLVCFVSKGMKRDGGK